MTMITCEHLKKSYGKVQALRDVSFKVEGNGCIGFLGGNGAGKTTTMRILAGLAEPTSGTVKVIGYDAVRERAHIQRQIGYVPQTPAFYGYMTGEAWMHWTGALFQMDKKAVRLRTEQLLHTCGLWDARKRAIGGYSGGMKQRLAIAQALLNEPRLLLLDEPVSALDPMGRYEVLQLIEKLKDETTLFLSTHILDDVEKVADQVIIIDKGCIVLQSHMKDMQAKYGGSVIEFTVSEPGTDLLARLQQSPWLSTVQRSGPSYKVVASDLNVARTELPIFIAESGAVLEAYQIVKPTLEDIFLKVVKAS